MRDGARRPVLIVLSIAVGAVSVLFWSVRQASKSESARFVGSSSCATCHPTEHAQWLESNHRHAMEKPTAESVLGDFKESRFRYFGRETRFSRNGDSFLITTENQEGKQETFTVAYTLGYKPLQQYLVDVGGGRIQVLPFAWDSREKKEGGQRWFHLYPDENVTSANPLFWTRPLQNWNHMCGDCHTTGFSKNFSESEERFGSRWSEVGDGCESCHGPGSVHVEAGQSSREDPASASVIALRDPRTQIDQCGGCHSRRVRLREVPSQERVVEAMLETWRPQLPQPPLYFADGQIHDEVFEIGSFLQSRMAAKGIGCTDCHDPHTARLKAEGNALCTQCHAVETFDTAEHHFHKTGSSGAQCVQCHMPSRTYMVVDPRRDHRFGIPRPDLSETLATPNSCVSCHRGKTNSWAAEAIRQRNGSQNRGTAVDSPANPIVKAAALASTKIHTPESLAAVQAELRSTEPLVRLGAIQAIANLPKPQRAPLLIDLARDDSLAIRLETARLLVGADKSAWTPVQREGLGAAVAEYRQWLSRDTDRADTLVALAELQGAEGDTKSAQASFEKALHRDDTSLLVLLNYADFHRSRNNDPAVEPLLVRAVALYPEAASAHVALGLLRVRQKRTAEAIPELARAAQLSPDDSSYIYVYAVGLYSTGQVNLALSVLDKAGIRFPDNPQIREALRAYCDDQRSKRTSREITSICSKSNYED
jgi:predicted CXXCH cytochrome family protein